MPREKPEYFSVSSLQYKRNQSRQRLKYELEIFEMFLEKMWKKHEESAFGTR